MATLTPVTFNVYVPGETVWIISDENASGDKCAPAVEKGVVVTIDIVMSSSPSTVTYNIRLEGESGTRSVKDTDVYGTDTDALTAYAPIIA